MFYKDNWLVWHYDGIEYGPKLNIDSIFELTINKTIRTPIMSYYDELCENARNIRDIIQGPLDLLYSGGVDSEVVLRIHKDLKIPINVFIFRYENNLNHRDFNAAIQFCQSANIAYTVVDFNLKHFFENDAYDIWTKCYCDSSAWLVHMKMTEYLDNTPVIGQGEPYWRRQEDGTWVLEIHESSKFDTIYHKTIGRTAVTDWYEYRPEIILANMQLPKIARLLRDEVPGKTSSYSHKSSIHQDIWLDLVTRPKLVGFEGDMNPSKKSKPEYMLEFERQYSDKISSKPLRYTPTELVKILCVS